jgi:hypothetical protein
VGAPDRTEITTTDEPPERSVEELDGYCGASYAEGIHR